MQKKKLRVLVDRGFDKDYESFLSKTFDLEIIKFKKDKNDKYPNDIDLLVFTGGSDVNPTLYGEKVGSNTVTNINRDNEESDMYNYFSHLPKLGICRGSQFLTVMSGGKLVQHVEGHTRNHKIHLDVEGYSLRGGNSNDLLELEITSTHHQMMFPYNLKHNAYKILGWSKKYLSDVYLDGENKEIELPTDFLEPEIVYYKNSRSLCVQGHPEMDSCPEKTKLIILRLIRDYLINNVEYKNEIQSW